MLSYLESELNSVERVVEYCDLPSESQLELVVPPAHWPTRAGSLVIEDLDIRYAPDLPLVLKGISLDVRPGEKIGIVGRSGAGKSTLAGALLRINEAAGGRILLDGIDVAHLSLHVLRSRGITVLAQDAYLATGSLRSNLDPLKLHEDAELLDVCRRVGIIDTGKKGATDTSTATGASSPTDASGSATLVDAAIGSRGRIVDLEFMISDGGSNLSSGTRQLVALARALLRAPAVIVLDESTASIDTSADERLQEVIQSELRDAIVLTIAHRLRSVVNADRIAVFEGARGHRLTALIMPSRSDHRARPARGSAGRLGRERSLPEVVRRKRRRRCAVRGSGPRAIDPVDPRNPLNTAVQRGCARSERLRECE